MNKSTLAHSHREIIFIFGVVLILFSFLFSAQNSANLLVGHTVTDAEKLKNSQLDQKQIVLYLVGGFGVILLLMYFYLRKHDVEFG